MLVASVAAAWSQLESGRVADAVEHGFHSTRSVLNQHRKQDQVELEASTVLPRHLEHQAQAQAASNSVSVLEPVATSSTMESVQAKAEADHFMTALRLLKSCKEDLDPDHYQEKLKRYFDAIENAEKRCHSQ